MPPREREIRPVFANDAHATSHINAKQELFKPTSPLLQRASLSTRSTVSARDEAWERKRQQALAGGSVQPTLAPDFAHLRSKHPDTNEKTGVFEAVSGAVVKDESRSLRDEIWAQKKKSWSFVDGTGVGQFKDGSAHTRVNEISQPSDRRRVSSPHKMKTQLARVPTILTSMFYSNPMILTRRMRQKELIASSDKAACLLNLLLGEFLQVCCNRNEIGN